MSRKYKQRGYQDDASRDQRPKAGPRETREGPRGRGLGKPTSIVFRCARCGAGQSLDRAVDPASSCPSCDSDLHTCTNCRHFDSSALNECRVDVPRRIAKKATRNDCELFEVKQTIESGDQTAGGPDARSEFDALFKF